MVRPTKLAARKGGAACFDVRSFVALFALLTLLMALWKLHLKSSCSCPFITGATTTAFSLPAAAGLVSANSTFFPPPAADAAAATMPAALPADGPRDPNKRGFRPYGNAAALFVQMGAYRGGPNTFAIVGIASKAAHVYGTPHFACEWASNPDPAIPSSSSPPPPVRTAAYKMIPDWGFGRVYTTVVVNCTFPSNPNAANLGGKLLVDAYYSAASGRRERFVALEEAPGSYDESRFRPPYPYEYLYCGSSLFGNLGAARMREWLAYHAHLFGPRSHFVLHDAGIVGAEVWAVLEPWVRAGRVTVEDVRAQAEYDTYYYNQFAVVNDCLHRYRHAANWTFFFDVDEYIYLPDGRTLEEVLWQLDEYSQITIKQNPMSDRHCVDDPTRDYSREWGFEKLVFRNAVTGVRRERKHAVRAWNTYSASVHMSQNISGRTADKTENLIRYYHYHNSINVTGELCRVFVSKPPNGSKVMFDGRPYVYDDKMKPLAWEVKRFEELTIGAVHT